MAPALGILDLQFLSEEGASVFGSQRGGRVADVAEDDVGLGAHGRGAQGDDVEDGAVRAEEGVEGEAEGGFGEGARAGGEGGYVESVLGEGRGLVRWNREGEGGGMWVLTFGLGGWWIWVVGRCGLAWRGRPFVRGEVMVERGLRLS